MRIDPELLKQLKDTIKTELEEQLQIITNGLLKLEKGQLDKKTHDELIANIFRCAHNIKGTSRSLDITHVGDIAHRMESIFSLIQKNTIEISASVIDLCLESVDMMRLAMQSYLDDKPLGFDITELLTRLENTFKKEASQGPSSQAKVDTQHQVSEPHAESKNQDT